MDFSLTAEQEKLRKSAREFLEKECTEAQIRQWEKPEDKGYSPELWRRMADMGWLGFTFPKAYGGSERDFVDTVIVANEMGRVALLSPYVSTLLSGQAILNAGNEKQQDHCHGNVIVGRTDDAHIRSRAPAIQANAASDECGEQEHNRDTAYLWRQQPRRVGEDERQSDVGKDADVKDDEFDIACPVPCCALHPPRQHDRHKGIEDAAREVALRVARDIPFQPASEQREESESVKKHEDRSSDLVR